MHARRSRPLPHGPLLRHRALLAFGLALPAALACAQARTALPEEGRVVAGKAEVARQGAALTVTQSSQRAVLEWRGFDIGADATVRFVQPSSSAVALNRVLGGNPSRIAGRLLANGHVYLVNAAGVLFAPGARVDVGRLVVAGPDPGDAGFMADHDLPGSGTEAGGLAPVAPGAAPPAGVRVAEPAGITDADEDIAGPDPSGGLLTLDAGVGGRLRVGLDPAQVQALIEDGGLQLQDGELVLPDEGGAALAASAIASGPAPAARAAVLRNGRVWLVAPDAGSAAMAQTVPPPAR